MGSSFLCFNIFGVCLDLNLFLTIILSFLNLQDGTHCIFELTRWDTLHFWTYKMGHIAFLNLQDGTLCIFELTRWDTLHFAIFFQLRNYLKTKLVKLSTVLSANTTTPSNSSTTLPTTTTTSPKPTTTALYNLTTSQSVNNFTESRNTLIKY